MGAVQGVVHASQRASGLLSHALQVALAAVVQDALDASQHRVGAVRSVVELRQVAVELVVGVVEGAVLASRLVGVGLCGVDRSLVRSQRRKRLCLAGVGQLLQRAQRVCLRSSQIADLASMHHVVNGLLGALDGQLHRATDGGVDRAAIRGLLLLSAGVALVVLDEASGAAARAGRWADQRVGDLVALAIVGRVVHGGSRGLHHGHMGWILRVVAALFVARKLDDLVGQGVLQLDGVDDVGARTHDLRLLQRASHHCQLGAAHRQGGAGGDHAEIVGHAHLVNLEVSAAVADGGHGAQDLALLHHGWERERGGGINQHGGVAAHAQGGARPGASADLHASLHHVVDFSVLPGLVLAVGALGPAPLDLARDVNEHRAQVFRLVGRLRSRCVLGSGRRRASSGHSVLHGERAGWRSVHQGDHGAQADGTLASGL